MNQKINKTNTSVLDILRRISANWIIVAICMAVGILAVHFLLIPGQRRQLAMRALSSLDFQKQCINNLTEDQTNTVLTAIDAKRMLAETDDYQQHSIFMKLDPYNINTLVLTFCIIEETGQANAIVKEYVTRAGNGETLELLGRELGWDTEKGYYTDILKAGAVSDTSFKYTVYYTDESTLHDISTALKKIVCPSVTKASGAYYRVDLMDETYLIKSDVSVADTQNSYRSKRTTYDSQVQNVLKNFLENEDQNNLYYSLAGEMDGEDYSENYTGKAKAPYSSVVYYLIGLIGGFILGIIIIMLMILSDVCLLAGSELYTLYDMPFLGEFEKKREAAVVARIVAACKPAGISCIAVVGTALDRKKASTEIEKITSALAEEGIETVVAGNISCDAAAVKTAAETRSVLVLETAGVSRYSDIEQEVITINSCGLKLVGAVNLG